VEVNYTKIQAKRRLKIATLISPFMFTITDFMYFFIGSKVLHGFPDDSATARHPNMKLKNTRQQHMVQKLVLKLDAQLHNNFIHNYLNKPAFFTNWLVLPNV
jgi:hypothetical protein